MTQNFEIQIPAYVQNVMTYLEAAGFEAFVVGGCVRDSVMCKDPFDWDVCTSAKPDEIKEVFDGVMPVILTGEKHGTVTVVSDKNNVEVTTYRCDGKYIDNRHPESVTFVSAINDDLARRDFTINAMAYNTKVGFVDIYGGRSDICKGIIRCVGDAENRFSEDALRIMRALRFSAVLSFEIEDDTSKAVHKCKELINNVSAERIYTELYKILLSEKPSNILKEYRDVFGIIIPSLLNSGNLYDKCCDMVDLLPRDINLRLAAMFFGLNICDARQALSDLKIDNNTRRAVCNILDNLDFVPQSDRVSVKYMLKNYGVKDALDILKFINVKQIVFDKYDGKCNTAIGLIKEVVDCGECFSVKDLKICGADLISLGINEGPEIGTLLDKILNLVIEGKLENTTNDLRNFVTKS